MRLLIQYAKKNTKRQDYLKNIVLRCYTIRRISHPRKHSDDLPNHRKGLFLKESFTDIFNECTKDSVKELVSWCKMVEQSAIKPLVDFVAMIRSHMYGIKKLFAVKNVNNGVLEGLNSKIQLAKRRARGFVNTENFKYMALFCNRRA